LASWSTQVNNLPPRFICPQLWPLLARMTWGFDCWKLAPFPHFMAPGLGRSNMYRKKMEFQKLIFCKKLDHVI
jgi:hypothetical protein